MDDIDFLSEGGTKESKNSAGNKLPADDQNIEWSQSSSQSSSLLSDRGRTLSPEAVNQKSVSPEVDTVLVEKKGKDAKSYLDALLGLFRKPSQSDRKEIEGETVQYSESEFKSPSSELRSNPVNRKEKAVSPAPEINRPLPAPIGLWTKSFAREARPAVVPSPELSKPLPSPIGLWSKTFTKAAEAGGALTSEKGLKDKSFQVHTHWLAKWSPWVKDQAKFFSLDFVTKTDDKNKSMARKHSAAKNGKDEFSDSEWEEFKLVEADLVLRQSGSDNDIYAALALICSFCLLSILAAAASFAVIDGNEQRHLLKQASYRRNVAELDAELIRLNDKLTRQKDLSDRVSALRTLLAERPSWSKFFATIEGMTYPDVYYQSDVSVDESGELDLSVRTTSYERMEQQLRYYRSTSTVTSVFTDSATLDDDGVSFQVKLKLDSSALH